MGNSLSYSKINTYMTCGKKYQYQYVEKLKEDFISSALIFGSAIDAALNTLLITRDLELAKDAFYDNWMYQNVNGVDVHLKTYPHINYKENDLDIDFIKQRKQLDFDKLSRIVKDREKNYPISLEDTILFNTACWYSLFAKGVIMLESYNKEIIPKVKEVLAIQHKFQMVNGEGDIINSIADAVLKWEDDRIILFDNKTSSVHYERNKAARSPQLIVYYNALKDVFSIDSVGYIVLDKSIIKNKVKICGKCGYDGSGKQHKTCPETFQNERCHGEWLEKISPKCYIYTVINDISPTSEELVMTTFNEASQGIKNNIFHRNLNACTSPFPCPFINKCWNNTEDGLIKKG